MFFILAKGITPDLKIATELAEIMKKREHKKISEDEYGDKIKVLKDELTISRNKLKAELNTFLSDRPECKSQEAEKFLNK